MKNKIYKFIRGECKITIGNRGAAIIHLFAAIVIILSDNCIIKVAGVLFFSLLFILSTLSYIEELVSQKVSKNGVKNESKKSG